MPSRIGDTASRIARARQLEAQRRREAERAERARAEQARAANQRAAQQAINRSRFEPRPAPTSVDRAPRLRPDPATTSSATGTPQPLTAARAVREQRLEQARAAETALQSLEAQNRSQPSPVLQQALHHSSLEVSRLYREAGEAAAQEIDLHTQPPTSITAAERYAQQVHGASDHPAYASGIAGGQQAIAEARDAERVQHAAEAVQTAYDDGGALAAARELEQRSETLGSPELVDDLIAESGPVLEEIARTLTDRIEDGDDDSDENPVTKGTIAALAGVADLASDDGVEALVRPLAAALPDKDRLNQFDDAFNELDDGSGRGLRLGLALANQLHAAGKTETAGQIRGEAMDALNAVRGDYEGAREARENADARMQQMLAEVQELLTPEQQSAFIEGFRAQNAEIYEAEAEAASRLSHELTANAAAIDQVVVDDPGRADDVFKAYEQLAQSPLPAAATEWAARVTQAGSPTEAIFADRAEDIVTRIVEPGLPGTLTQFQAEAEGDAGAALDRFEALFDDFKTARGLAQAPGNFVASLNDAQAYVAAMRAAEQGRPGDLQAILADGNRLRGLSGVGSSIAAASLVFAVTNLNGQQGADLVRAVGGIGVEGLGLAARAIGTLEASGRLASSSRLVTGAAFLQARVLPGLGVALSAFSTIDSVGDFLRDGGNRNALRAVTSAVTLVGGALALFPPTAPVGVVLAVLGSAAGIIGEAIFGADDRRRFNEEQQRLLEPIFTNAFGDTSGVREAARQIAFGDPDMNELLASTGLSARQFVDLMATVPDANDRSFPHLVEVLTAAGVEPGAELLETVQALNEEYDGDLAYVGTDLLSREGMVGYEEPDARAQRLALYGEELLSQIR